MRVYLPLDWDQVAALHTFGRVPGPLRACAVDPRWRAQAPEVDEEEWEYEAALQAAEALTGAGGLLLAADVTDGVTTPDDGWVEVLAQLHRRQVAAVLDADLAWYGLQELDGFVPGR